MLYTESTLILYIIIFLIIGFALGAWITRLLLRYPFGRKPLTGTPSMVGQKGKVSAKSPNYTEVKVNSQFWRAENTGTGELKVGDAIVVKDVNNLTLLVEKVQADTSGESMDEKSADARKSE